MTARGVQNKVLESIAAGLTAVVTPAVAKGLPAELSECFRVAATSEEFADAVVAEVTAGHDERTAELLRGMSWEPRLRQLRPLLESALGHT
jgi:hypothetical protein